MKPRRQMQHFVTAICTEIYVNMQLFFLGVCVCVCVCESTSKHGVTLHNVFESMIANLDPICNNVVKTVCLRSLSNVRFFNFQIHQNFEQGDMAYNQGPCPTKLPVIDTGYRA